MTEPPFALPLSRPNNRNFQDNNGVICGYLISKPEQVAYILLAVNNFEKLRQTLERVCSANCVENLAFRQETFRAARALLLSLESPECPQP